MAVTAPTAAVSNATVVSTDLAPFRYLEWGPIILGALGALAISVVLLTFGAALGLSVVSPQPYAGISGKGLAVLAAVWAALVHVASFGAGGYLTGRMRAPWTAGDINEQHFRDGGHGFAVWALGVVLGAGLVLSGVSGVMKTATDATTAVAAGGAAGAASNPAAGAALSRLSMQPIDYATDRLLAPGSAGQPGATPAAGATRADLGAAIARTFAANLQNPQIDARDRTYLAQLVSQQTGMPQAEAEKRVDETFAQLKAAEQKVRDAADRARKAGLIAAFLAAATLAIGCAAACAGAALGARHRDERTVIALFGSRRFW